MNRWRFDLRWKWANLNQYEIDSPIFLLGTQGGGLTLTARMLWRNTSAVSIFGDHSHWNGSPEMHNDMAPLLPDELKLRGSSGEKVIEERGFNESWFYATDEFVDLFRLEPKDAEKNLATQLKKAIKIPLFFYSSGSQKRFVDKSQSYTVKVGFLSQLMKDCDPCFVLIARNPYALCYRAAKKVYHYTEMSYEEKLHYAAQHWANSFKYALRDEQYTNNFLTIKFEDILREPEKSVRTICEFANLEYGDYMLPHEDDDWPLGGAHDSKWYPLRPDVNEQYLQHVTDFEIDIIDSYCREYCDYFEYDPTL